MAPAVVLPKLPYELGRRLTSISVDDEDDLQLCVPLTSYRNSSYLHSTEVLAKIRNSPSHRRTETSKLCYFVVLQDVASFSMHCGSFGAETSYKQKETLRCTTHIQLQMLLQMLVQGCPAQLTGI